MAEDKDKVELKQDEYKAIQTQLAGLTQQLQIAQTVATKEKSRSEELGNLVSRMQADFDNYRKRTNELNKRTKEDGIVEVVEKLLPILDNLRLAIQAISDSNIAEGIKMIYRQITDMLGTFNVTEIPALGEQFDPNLHNAVMQVKVEDPAQANMVIEVMQKGYKMGDRIIRHSVVKVAK